MKYYVLVFARWAEIQQWSPAWIACLHDLGPLEGLAIVTFFIFLSV